ncbi:hypothetical protein [Cognatilysobacter terrigena]|uniref:hypothetical protein n=1 Tax=Cognatilysobacter terrigena TaxID=2488749 RepID=UPI00105EE6D3|nr:hypothetical protein [Lysobacter terrigena]
MANPSHRTFAVLALGLALAACSQEKRDGEPRMPADEPEAAEHPTGVSAQEAYKAQGAAVKPSDIAEAPNPRAPASFTCDNGSKVDIADLVAVVTLKDGRTVQIARDPDDAFHFQGEALSFRMKDGQGELAQDEGGASRCSGG